MLALELLQKGLLIAHHTHAKLARTLASEALGDPGMKLRYHTQLAVDDVADMVEKRVEVPGRLGEALFPLRSE